MADRFRADLEFVCCLTCPFYMHWLAQQRYFEQDTFRNYLRHLRYFKQKEYAAYVLPQSLHFLDLLIDSKSFRSELKRWDFANQVHVQQFLQWQHARAAR